MLLYSINLTFDPICYREYKTEKKKDMRVKNWIEMKRGNDKF